MLRLIGLISFVSALTLPTLVMAEEVGSMTVDLDGEERSFYFISVARGDQTAMTASFVDHKRLPSLNLQAHPEPRFTTTDVLSVSGSWFGGYSEGKPLTDIEILFLPKGMSEPYYTTDQVEGDPTLTLDSFEVDGETGQVAGAFSGKMCRVAKLYEAPDLADCMDITGTFETALMVQSR